MLLPVLVAQLLAAAGAASSGPQDTTRDTTYETEALRAMVAAAARANRQVPAALVAYRAHVESELAFVVRDTLGREFTSQVEELASAATWDRRVGYDLHVLGYRSQTVGIPFSSLSIVRGWTQPMLYGDRLQLGIEGDGSLNARVVRGSGGKPDTIVAVHPFASDRDQYYTYTGGDTITVLRTANRAIPVARIRVIPNLATGDGFAAFDGEIDIDATRHEIVRMRGRFVHRLPPGEQLVGAPESLVLRVSGAVAVAYVEFVNAEVDGRYWLPSTQRIEFQGGLAMLGDFRSIFRILSRFSDIEVDDTTAVAGLTPDDGLRVRRVTFARSDSINTYQQWRFDLGAMTGSVTGDDFDDFAPSNWRPTGVPRFTLYPSEYDRLAHFNRVEGLYTGAEGSEYFRDAAPGLAAHAFAGWAWSERTVRGGAAVSRRDGDWTIGGRVERALVSTNDFPLELQNSDAGLAGILGSIDDADYVDRSTATLWDSHVFGALDRGMLTVQLGAGRDANVAATLRHGLFAAGTQFRPNRAAATGSYSHVVVDYEFHPNVSADFTQQGVNAKLHYEGAIGQLAWQRAELTLAARRYFGPITLSERADAGIVTGNEIPPQQLFELGGDERLPGYSYKEFAGDRAALFRVFANYGLPIDRRPHRVGRWYLPGLSPGFGAGIQGGWAGISDAAAQTAVDDLGAGWSATPASVATNGIRATVGAGLTFVNGAVHVGLARPIDIGGRWQWAFGVGQAF